MLQNQLEIQDNKPYIYKLQFLKPQVRVFKTEKWKLWLLI